MSTIRVATQRDVDEIVAVHQAAFETFFLTSLGPRFLGYLYRGYLAHPSGIVLVGLDPVHEGRIAGFVAGTTDPATFYGWLRRSHGLKMALAAAPALARRPIAVGRRLVSAIRYRGQPPQRVAGAALLASLAVDPRIAGQGRGSSLVQAFVERAREAGRSLTYCSTDAADNDRVLTFYARLGFREVERFRQSGGREMAILIHDASDAAEAAEGETTRGDR